MLSKSEITVNPKLLELNPDNRNASAKLKFSRKKIEKLGISYESTPNPMSGWKVILN
jgi:hypothetical protein